MADPASEPPEPVDAVVVDVDDSSGTAVDTGRWRALVEHALGAEGVRTGELGLHFVTPEVIAELKAEHLDGDGGPTDVLAFPVDGRPPGGRTPAEAAAAKAAIAHGWMLGDVVVCPAVAADQAAERGVAVDDELALLVVHGILHLLGHDHAEPDETAAMGARERSILEGWADHGARGTS